MLEIMKTNIKVESFLPVFSGFYNTIFEPCEDSEMDYINGIRDENGLAPLVFDDFAFDYDAYKDGICKDAVSFIEDELNSFGVVAVEFQSLSSPREYNFRNDSINVEYTINPTVLAEYITNNFDAFSEYIKERYTSRSGFISSHSEYAQDWIDETENFTNFEDGHKLGAVLEFICQNESITEEDMYYYCEASISVDDFDFHCKKVQCEECDEWFVAEDGEGESGFSIYQKQVERDLQNAKDAGLEHPKVKTFAEWSELNPELKTLCKYCK